LVVDEPAELVGNFLVSLAHFIIAYDQMV